MTAGDWDQAIMLLERRSAEEGALSSDEKLTLAMLCGMRGDVDRASTMLTVMAADPNAEVAVRAIIQLVLLRISAGIPDLDESDRLLARASEIAGKDLRLRGMIAHARSRVHWRRGDAEATVACLKEARESLESVGEDAELAKVLDSLALSFESRGDYLRALSHYSLSLSKKAESRDLYGTALTLGNIGRLHLTMRDAETALACLREDLRIARRIGDFRGQVIVKINIGRALTELGKIPEAVRELEEALSQAREGRWLEQEVYALKDFARALARGGERERADGLIKAALERIPAGAPPYLRGEVLLTKGEIDLEGEGVDAAHDSFYAARHIFASIRAPQGETRAFHGLARVAERRKDWSAMRQHVEEGFACETGSGASTMVVFEDLFKKFNNASRDRPIPGRIGAYRIVEKIGAGAYAEVYKAVDERLGAGAPTVALKSMRIEGDESDRDREDRFSRFQRECEILAWIKHPNVVRLIDAGRDPAPYLVMEYLPEGDLRRYLRQSEPLDLRPALEIGRGVLLGLSALHERDVVHRDLKPANVLLRRATEPVIGDFGMARLLQFSTITLRSSVLGTLAYMAPEQVNGEAADARTDLYAFGAVMYQLLVGQPYLSLPGDKLNLAMRMINEEKPPSLLSLRPTLPEALAETVERCLAKDPRERFSSAQEVLAALEPVAA